MAFITPVTFVALQVLTAAQLNAIQNNITAIWVGTAAGDLDYYTSSSAKNKLVIGAAYSRLRVNAGGTAPEWGGAIPRVSSQASTASPVPNADTTDMYLLTALAADATFAAPSGSPVDGQKLIIRIKGDATPRALTWNAIYRAFAAALPTITVASKTLYLGFMYNVADTKWDLMSRIQEP